MSKKIEIIRLDEHTLLVDGEHCYNINGVYLSADKKKINKMDGVKIDAIYDFLVAEKKYWESKAEKAVRNLLVELNFKFKYN